MRIYILSLYVKIKGFNNNTGTKVEAVESEIFHRAVTR